MDYVVIDTVPVHTLETGDLIRFNGEFLTVQHVKDNGDSITVFAGDDLDDPDPYQITEIPEAMFEIYGFAYGDDL